MSILPWQQDNWQRIHQRKHSETLPHALLLAGPAGVGKNAFARCLSNALLCQTPQDNGEPCRRCSSCRLFDAGNHPDVLTVSPMEAGKAITIDQIREIGRFLALTSQEAKGKFVVISPADRMNVHAANGLLKNLEEPAAGVMLILITDQVVGLPATIRSRCQRMDFPVPPPPLAEAWLAAQLRNTEHIQLFLALARGAPLAALALVENDTMKIRQNAFRDFFDLTAKKKDPIIVAAAWVKQDVAQILRWVQSCAADMIKLAANPEVRRIANPDFRKPLQDLANKVDLTELFKHYDRVTDALRRVQGQANKQLLLEDVLIAWVSDAPRWVPARQQSQLS